MSSRSIALVLLASELDQTHAAHGDVQNFVDVYDGEVDRIAVVGPERIDVDYSTVDPVPVQRPGSGPFDSRVFSYVRYQFRIAKALWEERHRTEAAYFHVGGSLLLLPLLASKLARLRTLVFVLGYVEDGFYAQHGDTRLTRQIVRAITLVEGVTCTLADDVILLSSRMNAPDLPLPWSPSPAPRTANLNYVDCTTFAKRTRIEDRSTDVVFVGRFAAVKGIKAVARAIPELVESNPDIRIALIGSGPLRSTVEAAVERHGVSDNVTLTGWVDHEELPTHLDDAKLLLMPSRSEGVPKALLEAMACGTVPVAAPVGGVPDVVTDGENGVLLRETDPAAIERTVSAVLERDDLDELSDTARETIVREHSYPTVKDRYRTILNEAT